MFDAFGTRGVNTTDATAASDPYSGFGGSQGYYQDGETGLLLLGHRYYDPATGRFLTRDPISYSGGVNLYECVSNSPFNGHDPGGLEVHMASDPGDPAFSALECIIEAGKFVGQLANHQPCMQTALCQFIANCVLSGLVGVVEEGLRDSGNLLGACAMGALASLLHDALDAMCNLICHPSEPLNINLCNLLANGISGCASAMWGPWFAGGAAIVGGFTEKMCDDHPNFQ